MATKQGKDILLKIARCNDIENGFANPNHSCYSIIKSQNTTIEKLQIPEPFNGDIETADILFIGLNPNIDKEEFYPVTNWDDSDIEKYFYNRLINTNGKGTGYWKQILAITKLIQTDKKIKELIDLMNQYKEINVSCNDLKICITEIIHCKSKASIGTTKNCVCQCVRNHLKSVLSLFKGKYIVIRGGKAKGYQNLITQNSPMKAELWYAPYCCRKHYPSIDSMLKKLRKL